MVGKRRKVSPSHSKQVSKSVANQTLGTHVTPPKHGRHSRPSADSTMGSIEFSNTSHQRKAAQGMVRQMEPKSSTAESLADYSRRATKVGYAQAVQKKNRRRRLLMVLGIVLLALAVAIAVGSYVFFTSTDSRLSAGSSNAKDALVAADDGQPYYVLLSAELGSAKQANSPDSDGYLLVRVDEATKTLTFVSIPSSISLRYGDGNIHYLYEARSMGGDAQLVSAIADFAGVDIAHYVNTDAAGLSTMVDMVGGVTLDLTEEVDDPQAGFLYLASGQQTLDAEKSLTLLRASNFYGGLTTQAGNRIMFTYALAQEALASEGFDFAAKVSDLASCISTDWTASDILTVGEMLRPFSDVTLYATIVPGTLRTASGEPRYVVSDGDWQVMMERINAGQNPTDLGENIAAVNPSGVTVEVRNGGGVDGAGAAMGDLLASLGYKITSVGNTDDATTYPETLIIYHDEAYEPAAQAIAFDTQAGRVINGGDFYTFTSDVLVIVGLDWVPVH